MVVILLLFYWHHYNKELNFLNRINPSFNTNFFLFLSIFKSKIFLSDYQTKINNFEIF